MEKLKWSEWGEKLKTSSSQMTRLVTDRVKEILQTPTPESKLVDEATLETMESPNWSLNLRICGMINSEELNGNEVVRAIKRKIMGKSAVSRRLSLDLLETCTMNCDRVFSAVASEKVLEEMVKVIDSERVGDDDYGCGERAREMIRAWGQMEDLEYLPVFRQTYMNLKARGAPPTVDGVNSSTLPSFVDSNVHQQPLVPPESYPIPDEGLPDADISDLTHNYGHLSLEQRNDYLTTARNSIEILSSILNAETELIPLKEDLTLSLLEKCEQLQPIIQRIIETTTNDETMLFEALNLHEELQQVISRYKELEDGVKSEQQQLPQPQTQLQPLSKEGAEAHDGTQKDQPARAGDHKETKRGDSPLGGSDESKGNKGAVELNNEKNVDNCL